MQIVHLNYTDLFKLVKSCHILTSNPLPIRFSVLRCVELIVGHFYSELLLEGQTHTKWDDRIHTKLSSASLTISPHDNQRRWKKSSWFWWLSRIFGYKMNFMCESAECTKLSCNVCVLCSTSALNVHLPSFLSRYLTFWLSHSVFALERCTYHQMCVYVYVACRTIVEIAALFHKRNGQRVWGMRIQQIC